MYYKLYFDNADDLITFSMEKIKKNYGWYLDELYIKLNSREYPIKETFDTAKKNYNAVKTETCKTKNKVIH